MVIWGRRHWRLWWCPHNTCLRMPIAAIIMVACLSISRQWREWRRTRRYLRVELMVTVVTVEILLLRSSCRHKIRTEGTVPIMRRWWRWHPSGVIVISKITSLRIGVVIIWRRVTSTSSKTEAIRWIRLAMPLRRRRRQRWRAAMIPDQADQPLALHGSPPRHRRRGRQRGGVRIERRRLAHAHPLVGTFPVGKLIGMRPQRAPHRRRRRVEEGVVLRRRRRGRRVEIVGEGVGR